MEPVTHEADEGMQYNLVKVDGTEIGGIMAVPPMLRGCRRAGVPT